MVSGSYITIDVPTSVLFHTIAKSFVKKS